MSVEFKGRTLEGDKGLWTIFPGLCKGCGLCIEKCPKKCISWSSVLGVYGTPAVESDMNECIACGICKTVCPEPAIVVEKRKGAKEE